MEQDETRTSPPCGGEEREKENTTLKEIEKESSSASSRPHPRARAREIIARDIPLPAVIDVHTPPSLELLLSFAHRRCRFFDDAFTREWFRIMSDEFEWVHPKTKQAIDPWPAYFREWRLNRTFFQQLRDPERIPDARKGGGYRGKAPARADNWRGTPEEDLQNVF